jgi:hypothetical protein
LSILSGLKPLTLDQREGLVKLDGGSMPNLLSIMSFKRPVEGMEGGGIRMRLRSRSTDMEDNDEITYESEPSKYTPIDFLLLQIPILFESYDNFEKSNQIKSYIFPPQAHNLKLNRNSTARRKVYYPLISPTLRPRAHPHQTQRPTRAADPAQRPQSNGVFYPVSAGGVSFAIFL